VLVPLLQVVNGNYFPSTPHYLPAATVVNGKAQAVANQFLEATYPGYNLELRLVTFLPPTPQAPTPRPVQVPSTPVITKANLLTFMEYIQWCTAATTYTNILNDQRWRKFYGFALRPICYVGGQAGHQFKSEMAVPCGDCGLVVRENLITVDHQRPQAGNDLEPICKVFRAVGLTAAGPTGGKGIAVGTELGPKIGGAFGTGGRDEKYTLNPAGTIYLTLINTVGGTGDLKTACLNHFVNLQPLCHACNSPGRNLAYYP
jgi:hypothetical protein